MARDVNRESFLAGCPPEMGQGDTDQAWGQRNARAVLWKELRDQPLSLGGCGLSLHSWGSGSTWVGWDRLWSEVELQETTAPLGEALPFLSSYTLPSSIYSLIQLYQTSC